MQQTTPSTATETTGKGFRLAVFGCLLAIGVLGLGAFTRLVDAGLGCPDWPGCYGHALWPDSHEEIHRANESFPHAPVETDKTWPEMVHRYFASTLGLVTIGLFLLALRQRERGQPVALISSLLLIDIATVIARIALGTHIEWLCAAALAVTGLCLAWQGLREGARRYPFKLPALLLAFILLQGLFGMWTVTLKLWPQVVTLHLLGGFTTLSLLTLLALRLNNRPWRLAADELERVRAFRSWSVLALLLVVAQIALGGWTTSNYAAVACPDLPTCQGQWLPHMDFEHGFNLAQHVGPNYLGGNLSNEGRIAIHMSHRVGAVAVTLGLLALGWGLINKVRLPQARRAALLMLAVLALQVLLGLGNVLLKFPIAVAVAHNLGGALLLLTQVFVVNRLYTARMR